MPMPHHPLSESMRDRKQYGMQWTTKAPTRLGFYYWQNGDLRSISEEAVRVVQVYKNKDRDDLLCHTLTRMGEACQPVFDCALVCAPFGRWAGPLPQPF